MKKISKILVCTLAFMLMISIPLYSVHADGHYTNYTLQINYIGLINSTTDIIIEDYSSSNEWFRCNGDYYTRIRFHTDTPRPQSVTWTYMYFENLTNENSILACKFANMGVLNNKYVPCWTNQFFQTIQIIHQPYENAVLFTQIFQESTYNRFNVSIGSKYEFDTLNIDWYDSENIIYYGNFEIDGTEYKTMSLVRDDASSKYLVCFTNERVYKQYNIEQVDEKEIKISQLYTYTGDIFPQYITDGSTDVETWHDFFIAIIDVPLYYLYSLLNFEIFGVNVWLGLGTLVLAGFVMLLIKKVL